MPPSKKPSEGPADELRPRVGPPCDGSVESDRCADSAGAPSPGSGAPAESVRPAYRPPQLIQYGDVAQITHALNSLMGAPDGMMIGPLVLKTGGF